MSVSSVSLILLCLGGLVVATGTTRGGTSTAPDLDDSDSVQFYVIESSFPYNTPSNIKEVAGESFSNYGIAHGGLGVWDTTTDQKFTIEFISEDYAGALLPDFDDDTQTLVWKNTGQVIFTVPTSNKNWLNSQLICETSGVAYNQLVSYIEDNENLFKAFQPVEVVYYNASQLSNDTEYSYSELEQSGRLKVTKTESFWFVNKLVRQLADYGADTESFLEIYATSYQYISRYNVKPAVVSWSATEAANDEVYMWYKDLSACYEVVYDATAENGEGADYFLEAVKDCYGDRAYVYLTDTSVYNVTLVNLTDTYSTPNLQRYEFDLPGDGDDSKNPLQAVDIIVITVAAIGLIAGVWVITVRLCCTKKERRRVSIEGERMAKKVVDNIAGEHLRDSHEEKVYYRGKPSRWTRMWNYVHSRGVLSADSSSGNAHGRGNGGSMSALGGGGVLDYMSDTEQHANSTESDPSSDLVKPLASQRMEEEYSNDMSYMSRLAEKNSYSGAALGYVSPIVAGADFPGPSPASPDIGTTAAVSGKSGNPFNGDI